MPHAVAVKNIELGLRASILETTTCCRICGRFHAISRPYLVKAKKPLFPTVLQRSIILWNKLLAHLLCAHFLLSCHPTLISRRATNTRRNTSGALPERGHTAELRKRSPPGPGLDSEALVAIVRSSARQEGQEKKLSPPIYQGLLL